MFLDSKFVAQSYIKRNSYYRYEQNDLFFGQFMTNSAIAVRIEIFCHLNSS